MQVRGGVVRDYGASCRCELQVWGLVRDSGASGESCEMKRVKLSRFRLGQLSDTA